MQSSVPTYDLYGELRPKRPDFWLHCETIAARSSLHHWEIDLHRHESFQQFLYIRAGTGDARLASEVLAFEAPCVVAVPPGEVHGFRFAKDIEGLVITVVANQLRQTAPAGRLQGHWLGTPRMVTLGDSAQAAQLDGLFAQIFEEFDARRSGRSDLIEAYLNTAILLLGRIVAPQITGQPKDHKHQRVEVLQDLIAGHFRTHHSVEAYAGMLNLSPTHLNRLAREVTGSTTHDLVMARLIDEAKRALVFTPATVQSIADTLGFNDAGYFSRCFRLRTGQTPRGYRETQKLKLQAEQGG
jgi:AraC family transcriptional activator of pobA